MNLPADILNQALDAAGVDLSIGDPEEGTREAQVCLRAYGQCLRQLLRAANWDFARKTAPLSLLADATGLTAYVGSIVPSPWVYEYAYPTDCAKARFVIANPNAQVGAPAGNVALPTTPLMTGMGQGALADQRIRPARFTIATDFNYPPQPGQITWEVQGVSPQGRTVVLTNAQNAQIVYTATMLYPSTWDALFRAALVAYLSSEIALPLSKDKRFGLQLRQQNIAIAKQKLMEARAVDGNEGWFSSDIQSDWMRFRNSGGHPADQAIGPGAFWGANDSCSFSDGSAY